MRRVHLSAFLVVTLCIGLARWAAAEEAAGLLRATCPPQSLTCPDLLLHGCCDDFCPKPLPRITCLCYACTGEDYCGKPVPCVRCFQGCLASDGYCRKPWPELCRPLVADHFTCAKASVERAGSGHYGAGAAPPTAHSESAGNHANVTDVHSVLSVPGQSDQAR